MSSELVQQFCAMSGMSEMQAKGCLEAAGGDLGLALNLFVFNDDGGGGGFASAPVSNALNVPDWYGLCWPKKDEPINDAWLKQGLTFDDRSDYSIGLLQAKVSDSLHMTPAECRYIAPPFSHSVCMHVVRFLACTYPSIGTQM